MKPDRAFVRRSIAGAGLALGTLSAVVFAIRGVLCAFWGWRYDGAAATFCVMALLFAIAWGAADGPPLTTMATPHEDAPA